MFDIGRVKPKTERLFVRLPDELRAKLEAMASARSETLSLVAREAIREYVAHHAPKSDAGGTAGSNAGGHGEISLMAERGMSPAVSEPASATSRVSYRKDKR